MNPLVPLFVLVSLPILAIAALLTTDAGIEPSLAWSAIKTFVVLGLLAAAMSYGASVLAARGKP